MDRSYSKYRLNFKLNLFVFSKYQKLTYRSILSIHFLHPIQPSLHSPSINIPIPLKRNRRTNQPKNRPIPPKTQVPQKNIKIKLYYINYYTMNLTKLILYKEEYLMFNI